MASLQLHHLEFGWDDRPARGRNSAIFISLAILHIAIIAGLFRSGGQEAPGKQQRLTIVRLMPARPALLDIPAPRFPDAETWRPSPMALPRIVLPADRPGPRDPCAPSQETTETRIEPRPDCGSPVPIEAPRGLEMPKGFEMDGNGRPIENGSFALPETPEDKAAVARLIEQRNRALEARFGLQNPAPTSGEKRAFQNWERDIVPLAPTDSRQRALQWNDEFLQPGSLTPQIPPLPN